jgi:hypothetical protein
MSKAAKSCGVSLPANGTTPSSLCQSALNRAAPSVQNRQKASTCCSIFNSTRYEPFPSGLFRRCSASTPAATTIRPADRGRLRSSLETDTLTLKELPEGPGDEAGGRFDNVNRALEFAFGLRGDLDQANRVHPQLPLATRVTIAMGDVYEDGGTLSGRTVIRAMRMLEVAQSAQVVVDEEVKAAVDPAIAEFVRLCAQSLKGFAASEVLYRTEPAGTEFR